MGLNLLSSLLNTILVSGLGTAALTRAIADNYLGKPLGILDSYKRVGKSWGKLVGALLLLGLILIGTAIFTIIPCVGWLVGPGLFLFLSLVVIPLVAPVVIMEQSGVGTSLRRTWDLSRRRSWWLIGYRLILGLMALVIVSGPGYLVRYLVQLAAGPSTNALAQVQIQTLAATLATIIGGLLYYPLQLAATTFAYFDLRVRTEGFDMALLTLEASGERGVDATAQAPVMHENKRLITWQDIGYFTLCSIGAVALYAIFIFILVAVVGLTGQSPSPF